MKATIQTICYKISQHPEIKMSPLTRSQICEVTAAFLAYKSYAAMLQEEKDPDQEYVLSDAEFIILNPAQGRYRAKQFEMSDSAIDLCISELKEGLPVSVWLSIDDFYDDNQVDFLERIQSDIFSSDEIATSNAEFDSLPELNHKFMVSGDLWKATHDWSIEDTGTLQGGYSSDGDRFYNGDSFDVTSKFTFAKAGRAGLIFLEDDSHCNLSANEDWYDPELFLTSE